MRFDDMLATVLAREPDRPAGRVTQWRQLLDLLAQSRVDDGSDLLHAALVRVEALRAEVPIDARRSTAAAFAGRPLSAALVILVAADAPAVAGAILSRVVLDDDSWFTVLPRLSPTGRAFLRHRRDLSRDVTFALGRFGTSDLTLSGTIAPIAEPSLDSSVDAESSKRADPAPGPDRTDAEVEAATDGEAPADARPLDDDPVVAPIAYLYPVSTTAEFGAAIEEEPELPLPGASADVPVEPFEPDAGEGQIRAIISRIARFRSHRDEVPAIPTEPRAIERFDWEAGADGVIRWVEGAPREPLIGETIAAAAHGRAGVDAQAPGAFRRRVPFRDARLVVAGAGPASGAWRISGVPIFAPTNGRFLGYRGSARRPRPDERAEPGLAAPSETAGVGSGDSLRQLVHELRTPLNAIGGFAEMIRRQMRGPVAEPYRDRAQGIAEQAGRLMTAVDDLDVSARLDGAGIDLQHRAVPLETLLAELCDSQVGTSHSRGVTFGWTLAAGLPPALGDAAAIRRMVARLLSSSSALAGAGETIGLEAAPIGGQIVIAITRPRRLAGVEEGALLDPGYGPEGDSPDAPLLGLGFSLHLVRRLAVAIGGQLSIDADRFTLRLVAAALADDADAG